MLYKLQNVIPDPRNPGDTEFQCDYTVNSPTPLGVDPFKPPIENQGSIGACTAYALVGIAGKYMLAGGSFVQLSEDFQYWYSRYLLEGNQPPTQDTGCNAICALNSAAQFGICTEATWTSSDGNAETPPSAAAVAEALNYKIGEFHRIEQNNLSPWYAADPVGNTAQTIAYALGKGWAVYITLAVGAEIQALTGSNIYPAIGPSNPMIGGHALEIVDVDVLNGTPVYLCRNSWGPAYCLNGYMYIAQTCMVDMYDIWVVKGFNGVTACGPDLTSVPTPPTAANTCADVVTYVFRTKFGRAAHAPGMAFWSSAIGSWLAQQIIAAAAPADQAYMAAHPVTTPPVFVPAQTIAQIVDTVFQTYFGRAALPEGESFWAGVALAQFTAGIVAAAGFNDQNFMQTFGIT